MKVINIIALVVFFFGCVNASPEKDVTYEKKVQGIFEDILNKTINGILANMTDPMKIENLNTVLPGGALEGYLNISSLKIAGIKELVASYIKINIFGMSLNMTMDLPNLVIDVVYNTDMTVAQLIPLYGAGKMHLDFTAIKLGIAGGVNFTGGISLKDIKVGLNLESATFDLHGLLNNEDFSALVSAILNDVVAPFINDNGEIISQVLGPILESIINSILHPTEIQEIFIEAEEMYKIR